MSRLKAVGITALISILVIAAIVVGIIVNQRGNFAGYREAVSEPALYSQTRYKATISTSYGLTTCDGEMKDVDVILRFFDNGREATITSPTLRSYAELEWEEGYKYKVVSITEDCEARPELIEAQQDDSVGPTPAPAPAAPAQGSDTGSDAGEGQRDDAPAAPAAPANDDQPGEPAEPADPKPADEEPADVEPTDEDVAEQPENPEDGDGWVKRTPEEDFPVIVVPPNQDNYIDEDDPDNTIDFNVVEQDDPDWDLDGLGTAMTPTAWEDIIGEPGLAQRGPGAELDDIDFGANPIRLVGRASTVEGGMNAESADKGPWPYDYDVIFRLNEEMDLGTVTYPELQCHSTLDLPVDHDSLEEHSSIGECGDSGQWLIEKGSAGYKGRFFPNGVAGRPQVEVDLITTDWNDVAGELGLAKSGPAVTGRQEVAEPTTEESTPETTTSSKPKPKPQAEAKGGCDPSDFEFAFGGQRTGLHVSFCDGRWASVGAMQTDWIQRFYFSDGTWKKLPAAGTVQVGLHQACYVLEEPALQGAPPQFTENLPICEPEDLGKF